MAAKKKTTAKKAAKAPQPTRDEIRFLFDRFLTDEKEFLAENGKARDWGRETRTAKSLLKKYEFPFWKFINLGFRIRFLKWFSSDAGIKLLNDKYKDYLSTKTPEKVVDKKIDFDYTRVTVKTKKDIRDRLFE